MVKRNESNELRLTRVYDAPAQVVWDAWTVPEQVAKWWGPRGFTITTHEKDLRVGGSWRYTMHGPDGVDYPNVTKYFVVEKHKKLVYDHGGTDDRPPLFRVTVTFTEMNGKTTMDMIFRLATPEAAREIAKFIKQAGGETTWDRLAEYIDETRAQKTRFVLNRSFDAPIDRVFEMWTHPEQLQKWLAPVGTTMSFLRSGIAPGKSTLFVIKSEHGTMHVRAEYLEIERPHRVVYLQQFVDEHEQPASAPGADVWPAVLRTTVLIAEEGPDRTRVTVTTEPHGETSSAELNAFILERPGMSVGWTGSLDACEVLLDGEPG